MEILGTKN